MAKGSIRDPDAYMRAALRRRTERFDDCFPRGISLGDIDSFIEINGHFLFLEWKVADQEIRAGQRIALGRLAAALDVIDVWILWTTEDGFITHGMRLGVHRHRVPVSEEGVRQRLKEWVTKAEDRRPHALIRHGSER